MAKISRTRGKAFELQIARYLNCKREHFKSNDLDHPYLAPECKHRRSLATLERWMTQAETVAPSGRIPLVVTHSARQKVCDCIVLMRLSEFYALMNNVWGNNETEQSANPKNTPKSPPLTP